jgi:autotransporter-associated beta strand protein
VQQGGTLTIGAGSLSGGSVVAGSGGTARSSGANGSAFGSGIFLQGNQTITFAPSASQILSISDVITDQSGSGGTGANAGSGSVLINGAGTVVLSAFDTYTGSTVVEAGTLQLGAGGATGSVIGTIFVNTGAALVVDRSDNFTFAGGVFGGGSVVQDGSGTLILAGPDLYGGGTTIEAGTLELGTLQVGGTQAAGTGAITFAAGAVTLRIDGTAMPTNTLDGFVAGDRIQLAGIANVAGSHADMNYATNVLTVTEGAATYRLDFNPGEDFAGKFFHLSAVGGGTEITENSTPCYCPGTLIRTKRGHKRVEKLKIGDEVMTASGALRPVKWIGRRSYGGRFVMGRKDILPVCIKAGALADGVPARDLWISPHHAMYFENDGCGVLIEAKDLVNGISIVQAQRVEKVEYFHVELEMHDVIIAEGALSETFLDDGSRGMFHNADEFRALYPHEPVFAHYCAPRLEAGYEVEVVRQRLRLRAGPVHAGPGRRPSVVVHRRAARAA